MAKSDGTPMLVGLTAEPSTVRLVVTTTLNSRLTDTKLTKLNRASGAALASDNELME